MPMVNTTELARRYGATTRALENRLLKLGITPAQEMIQPSGKRFILWSVETAIPALEKYKADRLNSRIERQPRTFQRDTTATDKLQNEVQELKAMMAALLEQLKKRD